MISDIFAKINESAKEIEGKIIAYRRDFHKYPELGWTEYRTSSLIAKRLAELGYEVKVGTDILKAEDRMGLPSREVLDEAWERAIRQGGDIKFMEAMKNGFTGAVGIISNGDGPVRAFRFDIDALPIQESIDEKHRPHKEGFASINDGIMHACGHDCHAAIGLGVAEILMSLKDKIKGTIKLIFQPAEEGVRGAKSMVTKGLLDDVKAVIGSHVKEYPVGNIASGLSGYKATTKFDVLIQGKPAHAGGNPQDGNNALMAAATATLNLYAIQRHKDGPTRINVGKLVAGSGRNIIPDIAYMMVETRGSTSALNSYMYEKAINIIKTSCQMQDCTYEIIPMGEAPSGKSDAAMMKLVEETAKEIGGYDILDSEESGGSEDFTYMMAKVQENGGKAVNIGIGADKIGGGAHTYDFDVNEKALKSAIVLLSALAYK
jgi:aminobenzoyl-glutamate utilization protein A